MNRPHLLHIAPMVVALLVSLPATALVAAEQEPKPIWFVVGRADLMGPLEPLAGKRRSEGLETVFSTRTVDKALAALPRKPAFLLLVGDDEPGRQSEPWYLPAKRMPMYRWSLNQEEQFASDTAYGDLDGDNVPDVAVGRIPARTPEQVELAVGKILAFERQSPGPADLRLPAWTGSPQYGAALEVMATELVLGLLRAKAPAWTRPWVLAGNPNHPLCGWPPDQPATFTRQLRRGGVCGVLMGHAGPERFFSMVHGGQRLRYAAADAEAALAEGPPAPPVFFFSCHSGNFTRSSPCMAESFFFFPGGPVATVAATIESHPLTNYFSSLCLLEEVGGREKRLGTLWLTAQRNAMKARNFLVEQLAGRAEGELEGKIDQKKLRRDQILMYALLGDPATRLRLPEPLEASVERTGTGWHWKAKRPEGASHLEVGFRPARLNVAQWQEGPGDPEKARKAFAAADARFDFTPLPAPPEEGPWEGTVEAPGRLRLVATGPESIHVVVLKIE